MTLYGIDRKSFQILEAKLKEGMFLGLQIRKIMKNSDFWSLLPIYDKSGWKVIQNNCGRFFLEIKKETITSMSEKQWESFYRDLKAPEERHKGFWDENMVGDYCRSIIREQENIFF